jgi:hypothetical protein
MRNRVLDMPKARWMTEDPLTPRLGWENLYVYANNNPVVFVDPSGLVPCNPAEPKAGQIGKGRVVWSFGGRVKTPADCRNYMGRRYDVCRCLCALQQKNVWAGIQTNYSKCMAGASTHSKREQCWLIEADAIRWLGNLDSKCTQNCINRAPGGIEPDNPPIWLEG